MDDGPLLAAIQHGDREAFRLLVERETGGLFRAAYRILGSVPDAEDATQEAFVNAYRALGTYRGEGPLAAWLARIVTRVAMRRASRGGAAVSLDAFAEPLPLASPEPDPLARLVGAERDQAVRMAVAALPEPYRETVVLRFFAELPLDDIAAVTGRPLNTVKTHLRRGLMRLRETMGQEAVA